MTRIEKDEAREARLHNEIIVDAYGEEEQAMGWYNYLDECLHTPFRARCMEEHAISPLRKGEEVTVAGLAPEDDCLHAMLVMIHWQDRTLGVPLAQLEGIDVDDDTAEAIADWHY
ncbi:MAG TPA: calcium-binding protein [Armatimonadota bacterium]|jgi:hypothetical protein